MWISSAWDVLALFLIPIGGGIPAGVILAKHHGFHWPATVVLYLISDVALALVFEPVVVLVKKLALRHAKLALAIRAIKAATEKIISKYGVNPNPLTLIMISFVVDPMTGRTAALTAGHGFITGWTFAILGDMIFFTILMVSTLCLNNILGDGTWTTVIITVAVMGIHFAVKRFREKRA